MPITVECQCGKKLKAKDEAAGRTAKCPACGNPVTFPVLEEAADTPPPKIDLGDDDDAFASHLRNKPDEPEPTPSTPPPLPKAEWHYSKDGDRQGPVAFHAIQQLVTSGDLKPTDMVWKQGMAEWGSVSSTPELSQNFVSPPSLPGKKEQTFFSKNGVTITSARFVVPGQTYAINGITSVMSKGLRPVVGPLICYLLGLTLTVGGLIAWV